MSNRYGVDGEYFKKELEVVIRSMDSYTPSELLRVFNGLMGAVRPIDSCAKCEKQSLVIFDDESNECLSCQNLQDVKGT